MQIDKIVTFHKVIGDLTRLRILMVLKEKPLCGMEIAERVGVTTATISHHMQKLKEIAVVYDRRDKNTIYFHLDLNTLERKAGSMMSMLQKGDSSDGDVNQDKESKYRNNVLKNFFTIDLKLKNIPAQRKKKRIVLEKIIEDLQIGKDYTEKEINEHILQYHEDFATIRREFIINHYFYRENGIYTLNPREAWATTE